MPPLSHRMDDKKRMDSVDDNEHEGVNRRIGELELHIRQASLELEQLTSSLTKKESADVGTSAINDTPTSNEGEQPVIAPFKCGYLSKWNDRAISGFSGSKWDKRFVVLENGKLAYYKTHTDAAPRYVLSLNQCAVRDDGSKQVNTRKFDAKRVSMSSEPVEGRFYYVFSIYQRPHTANSDRRDGREIVRALSAEDDDETEIVPLLRFSTQSLAEKNQWVDLISQACAYCDAKSQLQMCDEDVGEWPAKRKPAMPLPQAKPGTLAPIYFGAPAASGKPARFPSGIDAKNYRMKSKLARSAGSNSRLVSGYAPSRPMHRSSEPSYLSAEAPVQNFRGLLNLALIILGVSNVRIISDTMKKYGCVLTTAPDLSGFTEAPLDFPFIFGLLIIHICIVLSYLIELALSRRLFGETLGFVLHGIAANSSLALPVAIVWFAIDRPVVGAALLLYSTITWMKLISYAHANSDHRTRDSHSSLALIGDLETDSKDISYPKNVTLGNIYYFWFAPTLTYQIAFPRSPRVRWAKVAGIVFRMAVAAAFIIFLVVQVVSPNLDHLVKDLEEGGGITLHLLGDYLLKLAIVNTYVWLLVFYIFFHLFLNLCAEILRFGDRVFYKDWWNASEVSAYWRLWNMPVHYWLVRHVYFPIVRRGMSKTMATVVVFFVSAILHELLLSVPFHFLRAWSFIGMMGQIPLSALTKWLDKKIPGTSIGNIIFWLTFCVVGQPMAILLYTIDYWNLTTGSEATSGGVDCKGAECEL